MKKNRMKAFLETTPSVVLALITFFVAIFVLFGIGEGFGGTIGEPLAYIMSNLLIAGSCFFIVRQNPRSIWYVPLICNITGILSASVEPQFWKTPLWWGLVCSGWVLSLITSIIGARTERSRKTIE